MNVCNKVAAIKFSSFRNQLTIVLPGPKLVMRVNLFRE